MVIFYHIPFVNTVYAGRTIYAGYKHAFEDMGHTFVTLTASDDLPELYEKFKPHILITALNPYYLKYLDLQLIRKYRDRGLKVFFNTPFWNSPISKTRINEPSSLSKNKDYINLIRSGNFGDVYYNICEPGDKRMVGFEETTGYKCHTISLAADRIILKNEFDNQFQADISYVGTYLPAKRRFFKQYVFPLKNKYNLKLYGQDWTLKDRLLGWTQKFGQYFNIPYLKIIQKPKLKLEDEPKIYSSSTVCINVHEDYQKQFGGDCNERTFKIPLCGGFEITDDVACIRRYFKDGEEIVIAADKNDWFEKINYYIKNPDKRLSIIEAGRKKVLAEHTYHNRVEQIIDIYKNI